MQKLGSHIDYSTKRTYTRIMKRGGVNNTLPGRCWAGEQVKDQPPPSWAVSVRIGVCPDNAVFKRNMATSEPVTFPWSIRQLSLYSLSGTGRGVALEYNGQWQWQPRTFRAWPGWVLIYRWLRYPPQEVSLVTSIEEKGAFWGKLKARTYYYHVKCYLISLNTRKKEEENHHVDPGETNLQIQDTHLNYTVSMSKIIDRQLVFIWIPEETGGRETFWLTEK